MNPMIIAGKCDKLKDKLMEFKEKAIDGFKYLDLIVDNVGNKIPINKTAINAAIFSFINSIKEKSGKIKENIESVKEKLEGTPMVDLFKRLEDKFEEYKEAFKPRWEAFIRVLQDLENQKEGSLEALNEMIRNAKEDFEQVLEAVKGRAKEIAGRLMELHLKMKLKAEMQMKIKSNISNYVCRQFIDNFKMTARCRLNYYQTLKSFKQYLPVELQKK